MSSEVPHVSESIARIAAGFLFLGAGYLKVSDYEIGYLHRLLFIFGLIELTTACWLFSGWRRQGANLLGGVLLLIFACFELWPLARHANSCGCFGRVVIPPVLSLTAAVSGGAALLLHEGSQIAHWKRIFLPAVRAIFALSVVLIAWREAMFFRYSMAYAKSAPPASWGEDLISHLGKTDRTKLQRGRWLVLAVDPACDACRQKLHEIDRQTLGSPEEKILIVVLRAGTTATERRSMLERDADFAELTDYVPMCVPAQVVISEGSVISSKCSQ